MPAKQIDSILKIGKGILNGCDVALGAMGVDILRLSKTQVPVSVGGGQLKSSGKIQKLDKFKYEISYNKEYATYQHRGMRADGSRVVKKYTYPSSKKNFVKDPADIILKNAGNYFAKYITKGI